MKISHQIMALFGVALPLFLACGKASEDQSGFASETTNGVALRGEASPGTVITAYHATSGNADTSIGAVVTANKKGLWEMHVAPGGYLLVLDNQDSGAARNIVLRAEDSAQGLDVPMPLQPMTNLDGRIPANLLVKISQSAVTSKNVVLCGIGSRTSVAADGSFQFKDIPPGTYLVRLELDGEIVAENMAITGDENLLDPADTSLVLEDFDDGGNQTSLSKVFGNSFWLNWLGKDSVTLTPVLENDWDIEPLLVDTNAYKGKSLHVQIDISESNPQEPALLLVLGSRGLPGEDENYHSLAASDSLTFMAKGTGTAIVELWVRAISGKECSRLNATVELQSDWTYHALAWEEMTCGNDGEVIGARWQDLEVLKVTWKFTADADFWLDEVVIPDLKPSDLLAP